GLVDDVVEEKISLGINGGGEIAGFEGGSAEGGGVVDGDRAGIGGAGAGGGRRAVGGVADGCAGGGGGDGELEGSGEEAAIDAEFGVGDQAGCTVNVGRARSRAGHVLIDAGGG